MEVFFNEKKLIISGEATLTPAFYADINSIKNWEPPFENISVKEQERDEIIQRITNETSNSNFKIFFD